MTNKKLEITFYNASPSGIKIIKDKLSPITVYVIPRDNLGIAKVIEDIYFPGIYYLINEDEEGKVSQMYIGQTRNGLARIETHNQQKDFWNTAILFLSNKKTFTLDMIASLELYAIKKAHEINRYKIENVNVPKYEIDNDDIYVVEEFYKEIEFVMASQGYRLYPIIKSSVVEKKNEEFIFYINNKEAYPSKMIYIDGECILQTGCIILSEKKSFSKYGKGYKTIRDQYLNDEYIKLDSKGRQILIKEIPLTNPSLASTIILGRLSNGNTDWVTSDGKKFIEVIKSNDNK